MQEIMTAIDSCIDSCNLPPFLSQEQLLEIQKILMDCAKDNIAFLDCVCINRLIFCLEPYNKQHDARQIAKFAQVNKIELQGLFNMVREQIKYQDKLESAKYSNKKIQERKKTNVNRS